MIDRRVRRVNQAAGRPAGRHVLYWCRWNRRVESNHALQFAAGLANLLDLPLLVLQSLSCDYPYANDRLHTFALEAVPDMQARLDRLGIGFCFHLARRRGEAHEALRLLTAEAATVVMDDYPESLAGPPPALDVECYAVDSSCIVPFRAMAERAYAAYSLRPKIRRLLPDFLQAVPAVELARRYGEPPPRFHTTVSNEAIPELVASCEIDHSVPPARGFRGGETEAGRYLDAFLRQGLRRYAAQKNEPAAHATSDLSPYLHFGNIGALAVALEVRTHAEVHKLMAEE